jgi:ornithine cyclodeaminase
MRQQNRGGKTMRQMDKAAIRAALPWDRLIEALAEMFREGCEAPLRHRHGWADGVGAQNTLLLMPAWRAGGHYGVKIVHVAPGNDARGFSGGGAGAMRSFAM